MLSFLLSKLYGSAVSRRNRRFDSASFQKTKLKIPVISIGNISIGGSGKTPFAKLIAEYLLKTGHKPGIIGSGYGRNSTGEVIVSDGLGNFADVSDSGDEMLMLAKALRVPVLVHNKKYLAAKSIESKFPVDCVIVDDGFQHRWLDRNLEVVLVDESVFNTPDLLPLGRLREPLTSLRRADVVCLMNCEIPPRFEKLIDPERVISAKTVSKEIYLAGNNAYSEKPDNAVIITAIAKPERFRNSVKSAGIFIKKEFTFRDHHSYNKSDINKIIAYCKKSSIKNIITTEKDMVKLEKFSQAFNVESIKIFVLPVEIYINSNEELLIKKINDLFN